MKIAPIDNRGFACIPVAMQQATPFAFTGANRTLPCMPAQDHSRMAAANWIVASSRRWHSLSAVLNPHCMGHDYNALAKAAKQRYQSRHPLAAQQICLIRHRPMQTAAAADRA